MGSRAVVLVDGMRRARRSEAQWRALVASFELGDETRRAFCARHRVARSTFDWWRKRVRGPAAVSRGVTRAAAVQRPRAPVFVELAPAAAGVIGSPAGATGWDLELELGAGLVLRLRRSGAC